MPRIAAKNMAKHVGIVACSAEGAALCYRTLCAEAPALMGEHGHPEITLHTHPLADYMVHIRAGNWAGVADLMLSSCRKLAEAGAELAICPDNTIHQAFGLVEPRSPVPWLHIARVVADEAARRGFSRLGVLGTRYLMEGPVYPDALAPRGIAALIPDPADRERINTIIFKELVNAVFPEQSRLYFNCVMAHEPQLQHLASVSRPRASQMSGVSSHRPMGQVLESAATAWR